MRSKCRLEQVRLPDRDREERDPHVRRDGRPKRRMTCKCEPDNQQNSAITAPVW